MYNTLTYSSAFRPVTGLAALARRYAAVPSSWPVAPQFDPVSRWYARIGGDPSHEAWLLTWLPGQSTDLHDHGGSAGAFMVVSGVLTEQVVGGARAEQVATVLGGTGPVTPVDTTFGAGAVRAFGPRHVHRIVNAGTAPAVSLHVYAPSLRQMTRYRIDGGVLNVAVVEKAGVDW